MKSMDKRMIIIIAVAAFLILSGGFAIFYTGIWNSPEYIPTATLAPEIKVIKLKPERIVHEISAPGTISYFEKAAVNSKIQGRVEKLYADLGRRVRRREPLARMETFELRIKLHQTLAGVNSARARRDLSGSRYKASRRNVEKQFTSIERMQGDILSARAGFLNSRRSLLSKKEIYSLGGASESELKAAYADYLSSMSRYFQSRKDYQSGIVGFRDEDIKSAGLKIAADTPERKKALTDLNTEVEKNEYRVAQAELRSARLELKNVRMLLREAVIRSPLSGVVAARNIELGEEIKQGEPLFTVVRMDRLLVSTNVPEEEIRFIRPRMKVRLIVDALDGREFRGLVRQVAPVIDVKTRTAEVKIDVNNDQKQLNPGMFTRCYIATREKTDVLALPRDILLNRREEKEGAMADVFIIRDGKAFRRTVTLGLQYGDNQEIMAGLKEGDVVAVSGLQIIKDGMAVRALNSGESKTADRKMKRKGKESERRKKHPVRTKSKRKSKGVRKK